MAERTHGRKDVPIKKVLEDVPRGSSEQGKPPVAKPVFMPRIVEAWWAHRQEQEQGGRAMAIPDRRYRASWAGLRCDRQLAYAIAGLEASDEPGLADHWRMALGSLVHDAMLPYLRQAFPDAEFEAACDLMPDVNGAATIDVWIDERVPFHQVPARFRTPAMVEESNGEEGMLVGFRTLLELKTVNGFKFKLAATPFKGPEQGPDQGAVIQGALAAFARKADRLVIGNLSLEVVGAELAAGLDTGDVGRFSAEWWFDADEIETIARAEHKRIRWVMHQVDAWQRDQESLDSELRSYRLGEYVPRRLADAEVPRGAMVTDPGRQMWVTTSADGRITNTGKTWRCAYCRHKTRCIEEGEA